MSLYPSHHRRNRPPPSRVAENIVSTEFWEPPTLRQQWTRCFLDGSMITHLDFTNDTEFGKLLSFRSDIDLTLVALELARDSQPDLDFGHTLEWIRQRAQDVTNGLIRTADDRTILAEISNCLSGTHGLHGNKNAFGFADSSFINRVVETGVGIPISLSIVYLAVAQQAGVDLVAVAAPTHFLTRLETIEGPLFLDAFHHGRVLNLDDCCEWLESLSGMSVEEIEQALEPAKSRDVVVRMLNNLKAVYVKQQRWEETWKVQRRLTAIHPGEFQNRRDLAITALKSNRPGLAIDMLEECLKDCSANERPLLQTHLEMAERLLSTFN